MRKIYTIPVDFEGSRFDRWFKRKINKVPQSLLEKYLRKGKIKVNNKKIKSSQKLKKNDQVFLYNIFFSNNNTTNIKKTYIIENKQL